MVALTKPADGLDPSKPYGDVCCAVNCCVDMYGIANVGTYHDAKMLGKTFAEAPELYEVASPVTLLHKMDDRRWTDDELQPIWTIEPSIKNLPDQLSGLRVVLKSGQSHAVDFIGIDGSSSR